MNDEQVAGDEVNSRFWCLHMAIEMDDDQAWWR